MIRFLTLLLLTVPVIGQDQAVQLSLKVGPEKKLDPPKVQPPQRYERTISVEPQVPEKAGTFTWKVQPPSTWTPWVKPGTSKANSITVVLPAGKWTVVRTVVIEGVEESRTETDFTMGEVTPPPTPPPPPPPPVDPAPIPAAGLHVLMLYKAEDLSKIPEEQKQVLFAESLRKYLDAKCPIHKDTGVPQYRIWDVNINSSVDQKLWQDALKRPRKSDFWIIISNGTTGYEGPLPFSLEDALKLLKKYGGDS